MKPDGLLGAHSGTFLQGLFKHDVCLSLHSNPLGQAFCFYKNKSIKRTWLRIISNFKYLTAINANAFLATSCNIIQFKRYKDWSFIITTWTSRIMRASNRYLNNTVTFEINNSQIGLKDECFYLFDRFLCNYQCNFSIYLYDYSSTVA